MAPPDLRQHFERLHQLAIQQAHRRVLKLSDAILKLAPGDADALAVKAVAQLQLGEYDAAARLLLRAPLMQDRELALEQAYAAYRTCAYEDASRLLADVPDGGLSGARQLAAQVAFRRGDGAACALAYKSLLKDVSESALSIDAKANAVAAFVAGGRADEVPALVRRLRLRPRDAGHEAMYNVALALAFAAEGESADEQQWRAVDAAARAAYNEGVAALRGDDEDDEGGEPEEEAAELAPLVLLCAYAAHVARGALGEALGLLEPLLAAGPEGLPSRDLAALAANNWAAAALSADPQPKGAAARAARRLATAADGGHDATIAARLGSHGSSTLTLNRARLALLLGNTDQAAALSEMLAPAEAVDQLRAVVCARVGKGAEADAMLRADAADGPEALLRRALLRAQLALEAGDVATALQAVDSRGKPAALATLVALHRQAGDDAAAEGLLRASLGRFKQAGAGDANAATGAAWCLQQLVALQLAQGKPGVAAALYKEAASSGAAVKAVALAQLARAAAAASDVEGVNALHKRLPAALASLGAGVDAAALEANAPMAGAVARQADMATPAVSVVGKHKRKRRPRLPIGHDASKGPSGGLPPPDAERWLPKWQRSAKGGGAAKKAARERRRAEAAGMRGGQGAARVDAALDRGAQE